MEPQPPIGAQQPQQQTPPVGRATDLLKLIFIVIVLSILAFVFIGGYSDLANFFGISNEQEQQFVQAPEGLLVMAIAARSEAQTARILPVTYDFVRSALEYVPADKLAASPEGFNLAYQHVFSGDGKYITFVGAADIEKESSISATSMQIYKADVSKAVSYDDFVRKVQEAEVSTQSNGVVKQAPSVSNGGKILYIAHKPEAPQALFSSNAEEWAIHLVSEDGKDTVATQGIYPKWVGEDAFVFLKNDGLYLYSIPEQSDKKMWEAQGVATMDMALDVSDDKQFVAWAAPRSGTVHIFRALNWGTAQVVLKGTLLVPGVQIVFSPDSHFLAVQTMSPLVSENGLDELGVSVHYFEVETLRAVSVPLALTGVDPNQTYLTDWRP